MQTAAHLEDVSGRHTQQDHLVLHDVHIACVSMRCTTPHQAFRVLIIIYHGEFNRCYRVDQTYQQWASHQLHVPLRSAYATLAN